MKALRLATGHEVRKTPPQVMDHTKLLYDIGELHNLVSGSASIEAFLQQIVGMVAGHLQADVCSIYVYDEESDRLVLKATHGLDPSAVDSVRLRLGEGLTGSALKDLKPLCVTEASKHPSYRHFAGIREEEFETFLAVPLRRGITRIGVLALQRRKKRRFTDSEIMACQAVASQLSTIIENAKFVMGLHMPRDEGAPPQSPEDLSFVRGQVAAEGYAYAPAYILDKELTLAAFARRSFEHTYNLAELAAAVAATEKQLDALEQQVEETLTDAASLIFATHLLLLKDQEFIGAVEQRVKDGQNPPQAIMHVAQHIIETLQASRNPFVREKVQDVEDLVVRLMANLVGEVEERSGYRHRIVIAPDLYPSDLLKLSSEQAAGIIVVSGGVTSHLAILARSLALPAVIADNADLLRVPDRTPILLDAETGNIYVKPSAEVVESFEARNRARDAVKAQHRDVKPETRSKDGTRIHLMANINLLSDLTLAREVHCEGVGLYRTEFPFIIRSTLPTEEEQYVGYRRLVEGIPGKPVTFRTLDIGGDKVLSYFKTRKEENPCLGMRSIRFSLCNREFFSQQIRAMLRAGVGADFRIMFPMISSLEEFLDAREVVYECIAALRKAGIPHHEKPAIGMMVELPSVVDLIEDFAPEVDFFSIGTNDFIQFMLGVDRTNEHVASFYLPHHPSVLRALAKVVRAVIRLDKEISVCGDMAHHTEYVPFLLGIGVRTLSLDAAYVPRVQDAIAHIDIAGARALAEAVLRESRTPRIARLLLGAGGAGFPPR
jgi:phosphotransferase system, enzyme I, PtsP